MIGAKVAQLSAHCNNIERYRRLLETNLSDIERQFIQRRLKEEAAAVEFLSATRSFDHPEFVEALQVQEGSGSIRERT